VRLADSSALVKYFAKEEGWEAVRNYILGGVATLDLAIKEVGNALWKKVLRREMRLADAIEIITDLAKGYAVKLLGQEKFLEEGLRLAVEQRITLYDALFIVAAKKLGLPLLTADRLQAEVARRVGVEVVVV